MEALPGLYCPYQGHRKKLTDGKGKLKKEFQTAYTLPLHFGMTEGEETKAMADNLARLLINDGYKVGTGFPGTPYLLFALSDHGHPEGAYRALLQSGSHCFCCPISD